MVGFCRTAWPLPSVPSLETLFPEGGNEEEARGVRIRARASPDHSSPRSTWKDPGFRAAPGGMQTGVLYLPGPRQTIFLLLLFLLQLKFSHLQEGFKY